MLYSTVLWVNIWPLRVIQTGLLATPVLVDRRRTLIGGRRFQRQSHLLKEVVVPGRPLSHKISQVSISGWSIPANMMPVLV